MDWPEGYEPKKKGTRASHYPPTEQGLMRFVYDQNRLDPKSITTGLKRFAATHDMSFEEVRRLWHDAHGVPEKMRPIANRREEQLFESVMVDNLDEILLDDLKDLIRDHNRQRGLSEKRIVSTLKYISEIAQDGGFWQR